MTRFTYLASVAAALFAIDADPLHAQDCSASITIVSQTELQGFSCEVVEGNLRLTSVNNRIVDLSPLSNLVTVEGYLEISSGGLSSLNGLENLTSVGGLYILNAGMLTSLEALANLATIAGELYIGRNRSLPSLDGLEGVASLPDNLTITSNDSLASLEGLQNLSSVGGNLSITSNPVLAALDGLESVSTVGAELEVRENPVLTDCAAIVTGLAPDGAFSGVAGAATIELNAPSGSCNSPEQVLASGTSAERIDRADVPSAFALSQNYPNPFNPVTTVEFDLPLATSASITIHDLLGRAVAVLASGTYPAGRFKVVWDASDAPSGVYVLRLQAGTFSQARTLVLQK